MTQKVTDNENNHHAVTTDLLDSIFSHKLARNMSVFINTEWDSKSKISVSTVLHVQKCTMKSNNKAKCSLIFKTIKVQMLSQYKSVSYMSV